MGAAFGCCVLAGFGTHVYAMLAADVDGVMLDAHLVFLLAVIVGWGLDLAVDVDRVAI